MLQAVHLIAPGCGVPESRYLPCSGVSGRTAIVSSCYSQGGHSYRLHTRVKIGGLKCSSVGSSFVCEVRRNSDFPRQNRHGFSRSKNRQNEGRDTFENFEEDMLSSENGPLLSLSGNPKPQGTATPGPREKEIVELFKKVQARLRERAATKEEKKDEVPQRQGKDNGSVDSLLKLLRKHSVEQVKRSSEGGGGKDFNLDQDSGQYNGRRGTGFSDLDSNRKDGSQEANVSSVTADKTAARPRSFFQRRSPVPRVKYQPVSYDQDDVDEVSLSSEITEENRDQIGLKIDPESEFDSEPELDTKGELFFPEVGIAELSGHDSHDSEQTPNEEHREEQQLVKDEDLCSLKMPELRALAKSRGIKGYSKMKKSELMELLSGN